MKMECKNIQEQLVDYIENQLSEKERIVISEHLKSCQSCQQELKEMQQFLGVLAEDTMQQPSESLRTNFEQLIKEEKQKNTPKVVKLESRFNHKTFLKYAAGIALLISAFMLGRNQQASQQNQQVVELKSESLKNKQNTMLALMENKSASKRIQGVQYAEEFTNLDPEIIDALVGRMLNDENTNVRLTAVNALEQFLNADAVKKGFIKALEIEKDPSIQITIIKILVKIQEKQALKPMKELLKLEETQPFIKEEIKTVLSNNMI